MIVVDTTALVYAVGMDHDFRDPCRRLISAIERGDVMATTTVEVIQEFTHVRAKRRGRDDAVRLGEAYATLLSPLLIVEEPDLRSGLELFRQSPDIGAFDAVLAAAAVSIDATALVSADRGFATVAPLKHVVPDRHGVDAILGAD